MKKILSLLSVLTIGGTAVPTTIAASPYQENNVRIKRDENINFVSSQGILLKDDIFELNNSYPPYKIYSKNNKIFIYSNTKLFIYNTKTKNIEFNENWTINNFETKVFLNKFIYSRGLSIISEYNKETKKHRTIIEKKDSFFSYIIYLNNRLYFESTDGKVYEYNPETKEHEIILENTENTSLDFSFYLKNKIYFVFSDKKIYEYNPKTKQHEIISLINYNFIDYNGVVLNNRLYFGSTDGKVYEYNPETKEQKIVIVTDKNISFFGVVLNNRLYFGSTDNKLYEYWPFELMITDTKLLKEWQMNFNEWKKEIDRQKKEDFPSFTIEQKRTWKGDKKDELRNKIHSLNQNLQIIKNSEEIQNLNLKVRSLKNDLNILENRINDLYNKVNQINVRVNNNNKLKWCQNIGTLISVLSAPIPVVGTSVSLISGLAAVACQINETITE
ncbi:hypothetical protein [Spiroplasma sp. ald]|uniref:hypothetical protein n=1 Tax=Spiroplasma sp. ald TaxID=2490849 RepID=UPI0037DCE462